MRDKHSSTLIGVVTRRRKAGSGNQPLPVLCLRTRSRRRQSGFTLLELIITLSIIAVLAAGTVPIARNMIKRDKEIELRRNLREIRRAIDEYKRFCDTPGMISPLDKKVDDNCYPPTLEVLVEGLRPMNRPDSSLVRFIRRIPKDPFTGSADWGMRSVQDDPNSTSWGGQNVFDVYSKSDGKALDGKTQYKDW